MRYTYVGIDTRRFTYQFLGEIFRVPHILCRVTWKAVNRLLEAIPGWSWDSLHRLPRGLDLTNAESKRLLRKMDRNEKTAMMMEDYRQDEVSNGVILRDPASTIITPQKYYMRYTNRQ